MEFPYASVLHALGLPGLQAGWESSESTRHCQDAEVTSTKAWRPRGLDFWTLTLVGFTALPESEALVVLL